MSRFAFEIVTEDLPLLTLLNGGVTPPDVANTYFIVDIDEKGVVSPVEILQEEPMLGKYPFSGRPNVLRIEGLHPEKAPH
jgi:uncharacterized protein YuzE